MGSFALFHAQFYGFILVFARVSAFIAFAPVFGSRSVPPIIRIFIAFVLAVVFTAALTPMEARLEPNFLGAALQLAAEVTIGAAIGFAANIFFELAIFAGYMIDYMVGFGFVNIVDPISGASVSILSFFYSFMAIVLFLSVDGHHILIEAMLRSYEFIPAMQGQLNGNTIDVLIEWSGLIFSLGIRVAAPMVIVMFVLDVAIGMIGKTVPQFQILVIGFPIKIGVGLFAIGIALKAMAGYLLVILEQFRSQFFWLLSTLGGAS